MEALRRSTGIRHYAVFLLILSSFLSGCAVFHNQWATVPVPIQANLAAVPVTNGSGANSVTSEGTAAGGAVLVPAGDYQLMTLRPAPTNTSAPVLCTEPSPDFATALGSAIGATASGSAPSGPTASISANESSTEAITAMLGRTAGVVALRDGLYAACQAYANGVIGKDAYALIISQYGNLLVALASGGVTGGAAAPASAAGSSATPTTSPAGIAVAVAAGPTTTAPSTSSKSGSNSGSNTPAAPASGANSQVEVMQQENIQALLVACITDQDPTRSDNPVAGTSAIPGANDAMGYQTILTGRNPLLAQYCGQLMSAVIGTVPALLSPLPANTGAGGK